MKKISDFNSATEKYPVVYAGSASRPEYVDMPTILQQQEGVAPIDTLPAQWWNAMWKLATRDINAFRDFVGDAFTEINNLLTKFNITLDDADSEQLYDFFHDDYVQNYLSSALTTINGDFHIKGNLNVDGIGEEIISTELKVGANTITLRNDNPTALGNTELAGVVTENYDGNNHNNIIAIDKNGVARTGDIDIATRILYSNNGTNFFTDEDLTIPATIGATEEVRDTGNQTSGGVEIYEGITYSNNDTQPLLTRAESNAIANGHILVWDNVNKRAVDGGSIVDRVYPIGSIYQNAENASNPSDPSLLGEGSWVQITDAYLACRGGSHIGASGGVWDVTLTANNIPRHRHVVGDHKHYMDHQHYTDIMHNHNITDPGHSHGLAVYKNVANNGVSIGLLPIYNVGEEASLRYPIVGSGTGISVNSIGENERHRLSTEARYINNAGVNRAFTDIQCTTDGQSSTIYTDYQYSENPTAVSITPTYVGVYTWKRTA